MDIVLFGIQGSGKGTLGRAVSEKYGFEYFETGAELRKLSHEDSDLARKVKEIVEAGHLVPNEVVMEIVEAFVDKLPEGRSVVFDGLPRKQEQADTFEALLKNRKREFMGILVEVPEEIALRRLTTRRICSKCKEVYPADYAKDKCQKCGGELVTRSDDNPESIKTRIKAYFDETMPVIERYKKENKMIVLDGKPVIPEVVKVIFEIVEKQIL
ncbi:MAG TPA: nucleoside monophosphate kinase [Candidatus Gracilibacteria bacterium]|nr:nucleoside monophosphate kinase [Candidatus Gracilibacteria bacterium]